MSQQSTKQAGPVSLILGATGAQGSLLAERLAAAGHRLVLAGRDPKRLEALGDSLQAEVVAVEGTDMDSIGAAFDHAVSTFGKIDAVANCIGSILLKPAHRTTNDEWNQVIATNLTSAFATVKAAGRTMPRGGNVVLFSTAASRVGLPNHDAIAAAKAGIIGLVQSAAASYASRGLRFNAIAPGLVRARMSQGIFDSDSARKTSEAMHPLGRLGEPSDTIAVVQWLMDPGTVWVTGQVFGVDGGLSTVRPR